tara:strand:- start:420 stop:1106 length:687 start_codon:yes stop_codon:yes gene_type:complete
MKKITFLFPLHNEKKRILRVKKQLNFFDKNFKNYDICFLLNKCSDNTEKIILNNFKEFNFKIYKFKIKNRGVGINYAIKKIKSDFFAICAVDNAWDFNFYNKAIKILNKNKIQIVYGSKSHQNSIVKRSLSRKFISFLSMIFLRILFPFKPRHDTQCIKLFRSNIPFKSKLIDYNYFAETQFALLATKYNLKTKSIPVKVKKTKNSKINIISLFQFTLEAIHFRFIFK